MATPKDLIATLEAGGRVVKEGAFTLDRDKAREKLRQFQLADPRTYVLELVQTAHHKGASRIEFAIDADDMIVTFDGAPFSTDDFEYVYASMFASANDAETRARRHLALGLNGAMALNPRWVRMRSGTARLECRPERPDVIDDDGDGAQQTVIHVKERFRPGLLVEFFENIAGTLAEEVILKTRCVYSRRLITLDGKQISRGLEIPGAVAQVTISAPGIAGVAALMPKIDSQVRLLTHGVWVTTHEIRGASSNFIAVVEGDLLKKDVSQADILRDKELERLMRAVRRAERDVIERLCDIQPTIRSEWAHGLIKEALYKAKKHAQIPANPHFSRLAKVPLWRDARGGDIKISVDDLRQRFDALGRVQYASHAVEFLEVEPDKPIPLITADIDRTALKRIFDGELTNVVRALRNQVARLRNERLFNERSAHAELSRFTHYLAKREVRADGVTGEVGLAGLSSKASRFSFIKDGCLLATKTFALPVGGLDVAVEASFTPTKKYDGARCTDAYVKALLAVARALPGLTDDLVGQSPRWPRLFSGDRTDRRCWVEEYLDFGLGNNPPALFLEATGIARHAAKKYAKRLAGDLAAYRPLVGVGTARLEPDAEPHALAKVALFPTLGGDRLSLADVEAVIAKRGSAPFITHAIELSPAIRAQQVMRLDDRQRRILRSYFPRKQLLNFEKKYEQARLAHKHGKKTVEKPILLITGLCHQKLKTPDGIEGDIAFLDPDSFKKDRTEDGWEARLRLLKNGRMLAHRRFDVPVGPIIGVINYDGLTPTPNWKSVEDDEQLKAVADAVHSAAGKLLIRAAQLYPSFNPLADHAIRRVLLDAIGRLLRKGVEHGFDSEVTEALEAVPLFMELGGSNVNLASIRSYYKEHGVIHNIPQASSLDSLGDRMLLNCWSYDERILRSIFGKKALQNSTKWLRSQHGHRTFMARPERALFEPPNVLTSESIDEDGVTGTVGLQTFHEGLDSHAVIELCTQRRTVAQLSQRGGFAIHAVINDPKLPLSSFFTLNEEDPRVEQMRQMCLARIPALMAKLARAWPGYGRRKQRLAWNHVVDFLVSSGGALEKFSDDSEKETAAFFESIRRFKGADDKLYSMAELRASRDIVGFIGYLTVPNRGEPLDERMTVILPSPFELNALRQLVGPLKEYDDAWAKEQEGARRRRRARKLTAGAPDDALVEHSFKIRELECTVWLPRNRSEALTVEFGRSGKLVGTEIVSIVFPCCGVVQGTGLKVKRNWQGFELTKAQRQSIERHAFRLYDELLRRITSKHPLAPEEKAAAEPHLLAAVRTLHVLIDSPQRSGVHSQWTKFYRRIRHLPLISLDDGRQVSLAKILEERPEELEVLGLWKPTGRNLPSAQPGGDVAAAGKNWLAGDDIDTALLPKRRKIDRHHEAAEQVVGRALLRELRWVRIHHSELLSDLNLKNCHFSKSRSRAVARCDKNGITLFRRHPLVANALKTRARDPIVVSFLASAVFSAINLFWSEITDTHERQFHHALLDHILSAYPNRNT